MIFSYFGLRQLGSGADITETVIAWTDNAAAGSIGPDEMAFRFTSAGNNVSTCNTDLRSTTDLGGLHIARFSPIGLFGLGNTFGVNAGTGTTYVSPQSLQHLSYDRIAGNANEAYGFQQITYREPSILGGGETA